MEELQATQEEAARQAEKFISFTNSVNHTLIRAEYDTDGTLLYANTKFLQKLGYTSNSEVEGQHISIFINEKDKDWFFEIWDTLSKGGRHFEGDMKHVTKQGKDLWTMATYTCVRREDSSVEKVLFLAIDTTEQKNQSLDFEGEIKALNISTIKVDYNTAGNILSNNEKFLKITQLTQDELSDKSVFYFIEESELENFKQNWDSLLSGNSFSGEYLVKTKTNEERWLRSSYTPVFNMYEEVSKVIQISTDVTEEKLMKIESSKQNKILREQEEKLRESGKELSMRLEQAKLEMKHQFKEIETIKLRNERTLEGALDAIITINNDCKIEFFNKAAEELWGYDRMDVLNKNASILFSKKNIEEDTFINGFVNPDKNKTIGTRQEIQISNKAGEDVPVLFLVSEASVDDKHWYTAFIQNIEVELF
jgi:PAS domain S-box-containing protein